MSTTTSRSKRAKSVSFAEPHHEVIEERSPNALSIPRAHRDTALAEGETIHHYQELLVRDASAVGSSSSSSSSASTPSPTPTKASMDVDTDMKDVDMDGNRDTNANATIDSNFNSSPEANDHRDDFREKHREHARGEGFALRSLSCSNAEGATACAGRHSGDASSSSSTGVRGKKQSDGSNNTRRLRTVSEPVARSSQGLESVPFEYTGLERVQSMLAGLEESKRRREMEKEERERKET